MTATQTQESSTSLNGHGAVPRVCVLLVVAVLLVFGQTLRFGYVNYDDDKYVYDNPQVLKGLTPHGFGWAFTYGQIGHWHPLTWISHMLDAELFGAGPAGPHLTNVILHAANAVLLFLLLQRMTGLRSEKSAGAAATPAGASWPSAFVAALFAIHPLRVESVAWVSERKDVLSGFFFMLTLLMYVLYAEKPKVQNPKSRVFYGLALLFFALGLLSKSMLVTLPCVLLLLDYWPLGRMTGGGWRVADENNSTAGPSTFLSPMALARRRINHLLLEKLPFFILSVMSCAATSLVPEKVMAIERLSPSLRIENALVAYVAYMGQMFYPAGLAVPYPFPIRGLPSWEVAGALALLIALSIAGFTFRKSHPYLIVGWLWYLGMLVPVSGIVQISYYARADRYTYLPQIGLYLMIAWAARDLTVSWRHRRQVLGMAATAIMGALMACASLQTSYWRNGTLLWNHTLACTSGNYTAQNNLGYELAAQGRSMEAIEHYQTAIEINPNYAEAQYNLGIALAAQGRLDEAIEHYQKAIQINPDDYEAQYNLGIVLATQGRLDEAIEHYQKAIQINPDHVGAQNNLGYELAAQGRSVEAIEHYERAIQINPRDAYAHNNLAHELAAQGRPVEAIEHYQAAIQIDPYDAYAHGSLANVLAAQGRLDEAIGHYKLAIETNTNYFEAQYNLGVVLTAQDRLDEAMQHFKKALGLNPDHANAHFQYGQALQRQHTLKAAMAEYQRTLELDPHHLPAHLSLAWLLATSPEASLRNGNKAVELARQAVQLSGGVSPEMLDTLAAAYAEAGRFPEAIATARQASELSIAQTNKPLADDIQTQLRLYEANSPYHEPP